MRKTLKKSGLTAVILITIAAIAFLPQNVAAWIVFATILFFGIVKGVIYYLDNKEKLKRKFRIAKRKKLKPASTVPLEFKYAVNQLSHRITDNLHSAFPQSTWQWVDKPTSKLFTDGGRVRISTSKTKEFNEADVILDTYGNIKVEMLDPQSISDIVKAMDNNANTNYIVDTQMWYEQCGQKILTDIITDLNARGTKVLSIKEDGSIVTEDDKPEGMLESFPSKNLWKKLIGIFEENGLQAIENEHSIQLGW